MKLSLHWRSVTLAAATLVSLGLAAKECNYVSGMYITNAHGEGALVYKPSFLYINYGTFRLAPGSVLTLYCTLFLNGGWNDCSAGVYRDGESVTSTGSATGLFPTLFFDVSAPGHYTGGCTGESFVFDVLPAGDEVMEHQFKLRCELDGALEAGGTSSLRTDLADQGLIPCAEPYTALGYPPATAGSTTSVNDCVAFFQEHNVVDWVRVELLDENEPTIIASVNGLLHSDKSITAIDGIGPLTVQMPPGNYRIKVIHRNHLPMITDHGLPFTGAITTTPMNGAFGFGLFYGFPAAKCGGVECRMVPGDVNANNRISYVGNTNDRDPILMRVGGSTLTNMVTGYYLEDVNMDGVVKYVGANNDRDPILQAIGGSVPTNVVVGQAP